MIPQTYNCLVVRNYGLSSQVFWTGHKWNPEPSDARVYDSFHKARACWEFVCGLHGNVKGPAGITNVVEFYGFENESVAL